MKKIVLSIAIIFLSVTAYNQVINGTILDKKTNEKIPLASVYFNGTFVGTSSDTYGNFTIDISNYISMPLTISCIGYYSLALQNFSADESLLIYLEPKAIEMGEILVPGKSLVRKRRANLRLFKKEFLGTSRNALSCEIMNEGDITFNYGSDQDTIKAYASKPIIIKNKALGYTIAFYLDKFEYYKNSRTIMYNGNSIFKEDFLTKKNDKGYKEKREKAYLGSRMHFFRTLWANSLESSIFTIKGSWNRNIQYDDIVVEQVISQQDSTNQYIKYISYPTSLVIYYKAEASRVVLENQKVFFDKTGYYTPGLLWGGDMLKKRIGDSLPLEYEPNRNSP